MTDREELVISFWRDIAMQSGEALREYFTPDACIRWICSNEQFSVEEFIIANCEYPGSWQGEVERIELLEDKIITVARVWPSEGSISFHAVSFFELSGDKIARLDEYWGDDGPAPQWRLDRRIGKPIRDS